MCTLHTRMHSTNIQRIHTESATNHTHDSSIAHDNEEEEEEVVTDKKERIKSSTPRISLHIYIPTSSDQPTVAATS